MGDSGALVHGIRISKPSPEKVFYILNNIVKPAYPLSMYGCAKKCILVNIYNILCICKVCGSVYHHRLGNSTAVH